jgi:hypothetical protein
MANFDLTNLNNQIDDYPFPILTIDYNGKDVAPPLFLQLYFPTAIKDNKLHILLGTNDINIEYKANDKTLINEENSNLLVFWDDIHSYERIITFNLTESNIFILEFLQEISTKSIKANELIKITLSNVPDSLIDIPNMSMSSDASIKGFFVVPFLDWNLINHYKCLYNWDTNTVESINMVNFRKPIQLKFIEVIPKYHLIQIQGYLGAERVYPDIDEDSDWAKFYCAEEDYKIISKGEASKLEFSLDSVYMQRQLMIKGFKAALIVKTLDAYKSLYNAINKSLEMTPLNGNEPPGYFVVKDIYDPYNYKSYGDEGSERYGYITELNFINSSGLRVNQINDYYLNEHKIEITFWEISKMYYA